MGKRYIPKTLQNIISYLSKKKKKRWGGRAKIMGVYLIKVIVIATDFI